jgi:glyoxylase-like metal-dependent hydrolase (beta-lactamase superfamily II)
MFREIFPDLYLLRSTDDDTQLPFSYLLVRKAGNVLFPTKDNLLLVAPDISKLGGVAYMMLGDRHHALPQTVKFAKQFGTELTASDIEGKALESAGVKVGNKLRFERQQFAPDIEIIPTPGHTKGAFTYLWTHKKRRFLFVGDTIVPVDGAWSYWVTAKNLPIMRETIDSLSQIDFDVILSNSFAASPSAWLEMNRTLKQRMFTELQAKTG